MVSCLGTNATGRKTIIIMMEPARIKAFNLLCLYKPELSHRRRAFLKMKAAQRNKMPLSKGNLSSRNGKAAGHLEASRVPGAGKMNVSLEEENRQLKQERDLLRALIDNYPDSIYAKDKLARKILANKANVRYSGYKNETEALGKSDKDLFSPEVAAKLLADDQKVLAGEALIEHEERLVTFSGEVRWMLTTKIPWRDAKGTIVGIIGGGRNITKQKEAELKLIEQHNLLRTLIDNLPDGIYAKDASRPENSGQSGRLGALPLQDRSGGDRQDRFRPFSTGDSREIPRRR